jgi:class 3 adenylate cyclase
VIERYGGTVEKFIGDAVMAVWGAPVAREDDAE